MKPIPYILVKCAMSLDGYLDDTSDNRLILSNEKDFAEVEKIRESCDAILVGAQTIRKDNPRLVLKSGKNLTKVTITRSGNLDPKSNFFTMGESKKIVYTTAALAETLKQKLPNATIITIRHSGVATTTTRLPKPGTGGQVESQNLRFILEDLYEKGVKHLLVEGGSTIISGLLNENLVDELQLSIAPLILGQQNAPRLIKKGLLQTSIALQLVKIKTLNDMVVLTYKKQQSNNDAMKQWLQYVIDLSNNCSPSDTAFAVGAALVDANGNLIADGYSRETDFNAHAEEIIFEKIKNKQLDLSQMTLYTSLEPCNTRQTKTESCVDLILNYGINKIVYAATEPLFFADANGAKRLKEEGKQIIQFSEYEKEVIKMQSTSIQEKWDK